MPTPGGEKRAVGAAEDQFWFATCPCGRSRFADTKELENRWRANFKPFEKHGGNAASGRSSGKAYTYKVTGEPDVGQASFFDHAFESRANRSFHHNQEQDL